MSVLADTSVWVEYLRGSGCLEVVDFLIDENLVVSNELIQAELLPPLLVRGEDELVSLLKQIPLVPLRVDWDDLVRLQVTCLRNGVNKVGLPDLIIVQNAINNGLRLFSVDKHFQLLARIIPVDLFED